MSTETMHKNSRIVYIRRLPQFHSAARKELEEYFNESQRGYGSYFAPGSVRTATGLTPTEEDLLMPYVLDIPKEDRDFRKSVTAYFENINVKVPGRVGQNYEQEGLKLEIGLETSNEQPVSKDNLPISIKDYLIYRHGIGHPWVAASEEDGRGNQLKQYFVFDPKLVSRANVQKNDQRDEALKNYLTIKDNARQVQMYLTLLGVNPSTIRKGEETIKLRERVDANPEAFTKLYNDKDKEMKYIIEDMVYRGILERVGQRILIRDGGEEIGRDTREAVLYLSDSRNSKTYQVLKARLKEKWKDTSSSMETDDDLPKAPSTKQPDPVYQKPAAEIIPAAPAETQEAEPGTLGDIEAEEEEEPTV